MRRVFAGIAAVAAGVLSASPALAWDAYGHRTITLVALEGFAKLQPGVPEWLRDESTRTKAAFQAAEPDRYRGFRSMTLGHVNNPEHYLDVEDLEKFGLTLSTVPELRYEYVRAMAVAQHEHGERFEPSNPKLDPMRVKDWPGFLPHAITEHHAKLGSAFKTLRTLERLGDKATPEQIAVARGNVIAELGHLSHFVGDMAQPLHTTKHHHGWVGDNPKGYTTDKGFHAYIDGTILTIHKVDRASVLAAATFEQKVGVDGEWDAVVAGVQRSFDAVEPLYALEKAGTLTGETGRAFIHERLGDAASTLAALYASAWAASEPSEKDVADFVRYDSPAPAPAPAP